MPRFAFNGGVGGIRRVPTTLAASGIWDLHQQNEARRDGIWPTTGDPYWTSVSLLLKCDGTNGSTTFTDLSSNNISVTSTGGDVSTAEYKFGTGSLRVQDSPAKYITTANSSVFSFPDAFTIEMWLKCDSPQAGTYHTLFELGQYTDGILFRDDALYVNGSSISAGPNLVNTAWRHIALTRSGATIRLFYDGVSQTLTSHSISGTINTGNQAVRFGEARHTTGQQLAGYIDEIRITKGVARYTANFTPPAAAFATD